MNVDLLIKENKELSEEKQRYKEMWFTANNSLAKYRKLEEEIGCPLDVVFKLVNQNELYYQFYNELQHWTSVKVDLRKKVVWYCKQVGGHYACSQPLSNYGKTFWLREDKSE